MFVKTVLLTFNENKPSIKTVIVYENSELSKEILV